MSTGCDGKRFCLLADELFVLHRRWTGIGHAGPLAFSGRRQERNEHPLAGFKERASSQPQKCQPRNMGRVPVSTRVT